MGFFGALLSAVTYGVASLFNPVVLVGLGLFAAPLILLGAPIVLVGAAALLVLTTIGFITACSKCNEKISKILQRLQQFYNQYSSISNLIPSQVSVDRASSWYAYRGGTTRVHLSYTMKYPLVKTVGEIENELKDLMSDVDPDNQSLVRLLPIGVSSSDVVIPLGNLSFGSADLTVLVRVKDITTNRTVATVTKRSSFAVASAIISFSVGDCDTCKWAGGKDANSLIDEYAKKQGYGFVRKILFWKPADTVSGLPADSVDVTVPYPVDPNSTQLDLVFGTDSLLYKLFVYCSSSSPKTGARKVLCNQVKSMKLCPFGAVYLPEVFVSALRMAGYADNEIVAQAKLMASSLVTSNLVSSVQLSQLTAKNEWSGSVRVLYKDSSGAVKTVSAPFTEPVVQAKDFAVVDTSVPYSLVAKYRAVTGSGAGGFGQSSGTATLVVDPNNRVQDGNGIGLPRVYARDAFGREKYLYIHGCLEHIARYDKNSRTVYIHGPFADVMAAAVKQMMQLLSRGRMIDFNCPLLSSVYKLLADNGCLDGYSLKQGCDLTSSPP